MDPTETARNYDAIAAWWLQQMKDSTCGVAALERTLTFVGAGRHALDVGCGGEGRFIRILLERGFDCTGLDISQEMITLAKQRYPTVSFVRGDVCTWSLPRQYDVIAAWDSLFHLPLKSHEPVLEKLCAGLAPDGVLLVTCGDGKEPGSIQGEFDGKRFEYSSLGVVEFVRIFGRGGCAIQHLERDQHPLNHVYIVAKKS